ncbi:DUF1254 domain-containing protein [Rhodococcus erythropolis]|uniref:DUF1254 domain-containing protein n=1 Tax=Rhodococcus erythropolis TaxID=1833 RepID=UPI003D140EE8
MVPSSTTKPHFDRSRDPITAAAAVGAGVFELGMRAYLWGYPAVITARTRDYATDPTREDSYRPNTFSHSSKLFDHREHIIVKPNNDTLYSWAWLNLVDGPVTLTVPPVSRYHSFQFMDAYTNTWAYVGSRSTGSDGGTYVLIGPGSEAPASADVQVLRAPTDHVWLLGRTLVDGPEDLASAIEISNSYTLSGPDSVTSTRHVPALSPHTIPESGLGFFDELAAVVASDPPPAEDKPLLDELAALGVGPGCVPSEEITDPVVRTALRAAVGAAHGWLETYGGAKRPGWTYGTRLGAYGRNHLLRAAIALRGLGALTADEAIYPTSRFDADGNRLTGEETYLLRFRPNELPPLRKDFGFWSITMYDKRNFLVDNPIERYSIGDRTSGIRYEEDGSLEIVISHVRQGSAVNWLPAPKGPFEVTLRCYLPTGALRSGEYVVPPLRRI